MIFQAYSTNTWIIIFIMYFLASLAITFIRVKTEEKSIPPDHISENYFLVWGLHCQQGLPGITLNIFSNLLRKLNKSLLFE